MSRQPTISLPTMPNDVISTPVPLAAPPHQDVSPDLPQQVVTPDLPQHHPLPQCVRRPNPRVLILMTVGALVAAALVAVAVVVAVGFVGIM
ncbi:hypothetical protein V6N12_069123 [Hibiscus sabdariffa]|uniref:Uncharacterized protein n=1 Tax=Hibiscus sabdariffa TaxID=183260 RepID=A0ABR2FD01_9ROSI